MSRQHPGQQRLAALAERPGVSPDLVRLEERLHAWREEVAEPVSSRYLVSIDPDTLTAPISDPTICLADRIDPLPAPDLLREIGGGLETILLESVPGLAPLSAWLGAMETDASREDALAAWFTAVWRRDQDSLRQVASEARIPADLFDWAGRQLCRPFFHRLGVLLGEATSAANGASLPRATCPACGGPPRMARLEREEGRRYLWCGLCDVQWAFKRVACPFCGNSRHDQLGYLAIEGNERDRIDVCEVCRGYLRTVVERGMQEGARIDFLVEDVGTLHLCMVAEGRGYRPGAVGGDSEGAQARAAAQADPPL